ncbi:PRC-barrel domain-containing protein [uncultured Phyllobacterium sp.]|uniref:PRC-barrel domain-containing protein n=1 Tax=uncultured Phyllobacterium sp. TaxID=253813 RepID=UPI0025874F6B|nr:PRC-barrel domain-containing protein [uncultured Phyllobacterium sp.]
MTKRLLMTTALITVLATSGFAQAQEPGSAATHGIFHDKSKPAQNAGRYVESAAGQILASGLIGQKVYNGAKDDSVSIGAVKDLVLDANGTADAAIIGVGGFVGIGEKDVAVGLDGLAWADRADGTRWLVIATSKEELEKAPAFDKAALLDGHPATDVLKPSLAPAKPAPQATMATRDGLKAVPATAVSAEKLIGTTVYGSDDETLGSVGDALMTPDGQVEAFVVDVGGFLGLGKKPIAISIENLDLLSDKDGKIAVYTPFTKQQLQAHPAYSEEAYKADSEKILLRGSAE